MWTVKDERTRTQSDDHLHGAVLQRLPCGLGEADRDDIRGWLTEFALSLPHAAELMQYSATVVQVVLRLFLQELARRVSAKGGHLAFAWLKTCDEVSRLSERSKQHEIVDDDVHDGHHGRCSCLRSKDGKWTRRVCYVDAPSTQSVKQSLACCYTAVVDIMGRCHCTVCDDNDDDDDKKMVETLYVAWLPPVAYENPEYPEPDDLCWQHSGVHRFMAVAAWVNVTTLALLATYFDCGALLGWSKTATETLQRRLESIVVDETDPGEAEDGGLVDAVRYMLNIEM